MVFKLLIIVTKVSYTSAKLEIVFEILSSQKYANFNYQQVIDGNRYALQFLFSFYRPQPSDSNFGVEIGSVR